MDGMMGEGGRFPLEEWFWEMPICTRWWTTATVLTSALVQCKVVNAFQLFYSYRSVFVNGQVRDPRARTAHLCTSTHDHGFTDADFLRLE